MPCSGEARPPQQRRSLQIPDKSGFARNILNYYSNLVRFQLVAMRTRSGRDTGKTSGGNGGSRGAASGRRPIRAASSDAVMVDTDLERVNRSRDAQTPTDDKEVTTTTVGRGKRRADSQPTGTPSSIKRVRRELGRPLREDEMSRAMESTGFFNLIPDEVRSSFSRGFPAHSIHFPDRGSSSSMYPSFLDSCAPGLPCYSHYTSRSGPGVPPVVAPLLPPAHGATPTHTRHAYPAFRSSCTTF